MLAPVPTLTDNQGLVIIKSWWRDEVIGQRYSAGDVERSGENEFLTLRLQSNETFSHVEPSIRW